ncbi:MAG: MFS transporter [Acidothermaceae bacterium]
MPSTSTRTPRISTAYPGDANPSNPSARAARSSRGSERSRTAALAVILICQLMVVLDATIVNIALPDIQSALRFSTSNLSWVLNAYALTFGGLLLLGARAGDLFGRRRMFLGGIALFTVASLAGGLTSSAGLLLSARALQGVGAALASPSALALLMISFREGAERARALALYAAVSIGGSAVGLLMGGVLVEWASWRWVFFVNVPIGIALLALARRTLPETDGQHGRIDVPGALTSTLGMSALVYGFVQAASEGWASASAHIAFVVGVVLLVMFVGIELRAKMPITPLRLFADRDRSFSYVARLLLVGGMFGMFFFLTQFLQEVLGYSALVTGVAFLPLTIALFAASQLSARKLMPVMGGRWLMAGGISLSTVAVLVLSELSQHSNYGLVLTGLLLFGIGNGLAFVPLTAASLAGVKPADAGAASGLVNVMQQLGGSLGLAVLVTVFGTASRNASHHVGATAAASFVHGADTAFRVAAIMLALSVVLVASMRQQRPMVGEAASSETDDEFGSIDGVDAEPIGVA